MFAIPALSRAAVVGPDCVRSRRAAARLSAAGLDDADARRRRGDDAAVAGVHRHPARASRRCVLPCAVTSGTLISPQQTAGLFFILAFGMIVRWRTMMWMQYQKLVSQPHT